MENTEFTIEEPKNHNSYEMNDPITNTWKNDMSSLNDSQLTQPLLSPLYNNKYIAKKHTEAKLALISGIEKTLSELSFSYKLDYDLTKCIDSILKYGITKDNSHLKNALTYLEAAKDKRS